MLEGFGYSLSKGFWSVSGVPLQVRWVSNAVSCWGLPSEVCVPKLKTLGLNPELKIIGLSLKLKT